MTRIGRIDADYLLLYSDVTPQANRALLGMNPFLVVH